MEFNTVVWYANIISALIWFLALIISIVAIKKVVKIENNIWEINQKHYWEWDNVWRDKNIK